MLGNLIGGFIVIVIGVTLLPTVANQVVAAQAGNVTGASSTILGLTTLFFALAVTAVGIGVAVMGLKQAGIMTV